MILKNLKSFYHLDNFLRVFLLIFTVYQKAESKIQAKSYLANQKMQNTKLSAKLALLYPICFLISNLAFYCRFTES